MDCWKGAEEKENQQRGLKGRFFGADMFKTTNQQQTINLKEQLWKLVYYFRADKWKKTPAQTKQKSSENTQKRLLILEHKKNPRSRQSEKWKKGRVRRWGFLRPPPHPNTSKKHPPTKNNLKPNKNQCWQRTQNVNKSKPRKEGFGVRWGPSGPPHPKPSKKTLWNNKHNLHLLNANKNKNKTKQKIDKKHRRTYTHTETPEMTKKKGRGLENKHHTGSQVAKLLPTIIERQSASLFPKSSFWTDDHRKIVNPKKKSSGHSRRMDFSVSARGAYFWGPKSMCPRFGRSRPGISCYPELICCEKGPPPSVFLVGLTLIITSFFLSFLSCLLTRSTSHVKFVLLFQLLLWAIWSFFLLFQCFRGFLLFFQTLPELLLVFEVAGSD